MTNEELDEARGNEAYELWCRDQPDGTKGYAPVQVAIRAARLAREGWTPPEPDPDPYLVAYQEWVGRTYPPFAPGHDDSFLSEAYLAGARMAREQEQKRAKEAVDFVRRFAAGNAPQFLVPPTVQKRLNNNVPYINAPYIGTPTQFRLEDWVMHPSPSPSVVEARDILAKYNGEA